MRIAQSRGVLLLGLLLVLAGCSAPSVPPASTPTVTETGSPPPDIRVPGVADGSLSNASALLDAHLRSLRDRGYRLETRVGPERMRYAAEPGFSGVRIDPGPNSTNPPLWANETVAYAHLTRGGETAFRQAPRFWAGPRQLTGAHVLSTLFNASDYRVRGGTRCGGGPCVVLAASGSPQYETFAATAAVDGDGIVHRMRATYTTQTEAGPRTVEVELRVTRLGGVDVTRPDWVATAIRRTG